MAETVVRPDIFQCNYSMTTTVNGKSITGQITPGSIGTDHDPVVTPDTVSERIDPLKPEFEADQRIDDRFP
jgi:hypothetical protein